MITDKQAAISFNQNYPRQPGIGGNEPAFPENIVDEFNEMIQIGGATSEMATAFILSEYNTGIALIKMNSSGNFFKLNTERIKDSDGTPSYQSENCN